MYKAYVTGCSTHLRALYERYGRAFPEVAFGSYWIHKNTSKPKFFLQPDKQCSTPVPAGAKVIKFRSLPATMEAILICSGLKKQRTCSAIRLFDHVKGKYGGHLYNLKGLTAAGKSSVVYGLIQPYLMCNNPKRSENVVLVKGMTATHTYIPDLNLLVFGTYASGSGGCDAFTKEQMMKELTLFWDFDCDILYEGVIVSDTVATYVEFAGRLNSVREKKRVQEYVFLHCSVEEVRRRLLIRNTSGELKDKYLERKWSKFKYMPTQYQEWADENLRVRILNAEHGVQYCTDVLRTRIKNTLLWRDSVKHEHDELMEYYKQFKRKTARSGDELLELSRRRSEQEDLRVHGRKINV